MALSRSQIAHLDAIAKSEAVEGKIHMYVHYLDFHLVQLYQSMSANDAKGVERHKESLSIIRNELFKMEYWPHKECNNEESTCVQSTNAV